MVGMFTTAPRRQEGKSGYTSLHQGKQAVCKAKIRYAVKEFSVLWEGAASGLAESVPFTIASTVRGQPCFPAHLALASPPLLSHHRGGDGILWVAVWGALIHIWLPYSLHRRTLIVGGVTHSRSAFSQCHCLSGGVSLMCQNGVMMPIFQH